MAKKKDSAPQTVETVKAVKAFNHDFTCTPQGGAKFQYEVGKTYELDGALSICKRGFHAVSLETPFHVWDFYPIIDDEGRLCKYAEVTQSGEMQREEKDGGTKIASVKIGIDAELSLPDFIRRGVSWLMDFSKSMPTVDEGDYSTQAASGDYSTQAASGDYSTQAASGDSSTQAASGYSSKQAASGNYSKQAASGDSSTFEISGQNGVIACSGANGKARGAIGTWISLAEYDNSSPSKCIGFASGCIGQDGLDPDVFYVAKGGKLVKA